MVTVLTALVGE